MRLLRHICTPVLVLLFTLTLTCAAQVDISCFSIDAPAPSTLNCVQLLGANESVAATIRNDDTVALGNGTLIQFDVSLGGALVFSEFYALTADLMPGALLPVALTSKVDLSALGAYSLNVDCKAPFDPNAANNVQTISFTNPGAQAEVIGYSENFDSLPSNNGAFAPTIFDVPAGWENDANDAASLAGNSTPDWAPNDGTTGSNQGPLADHTSGSGIYMYIEDSSSQAGDIRLISPCLDTASSTTSPRISFYHLSRQAAGSANDNILEIDVLDEDSGSAVTLSLLSLPGNGSTDWVRQSVDLSAFVPNRVKIVFRTNNNNGSFNDDVSIDDFSFFDFVPGNGQAPQAMLAVFDIAGAMTSASETVSSGANGPYHADIVVGGTLAMSWEGSPSQPIACLFGNLNTKSATYPAGIGQADIGGPGVDVNGYPLNLNIFGDGFAWSQNPTLSTHHAFFFTGAAGNGGMSVAVPSLGVPAGTVLTTMQCVMAEPQAPHFRLSNAIELTVQ